MLRWSFDETAAADAIEEALRQVLEEGPWTADLGGSAGTDAVTAAVVDRLGAPSEVPV